MLNIFNHPMSINNILLDILFIIPWIILPKILAKLKRKNTDPNFNTFGINLSSQLVIMLFVFISFIGLMRNSLDLVFAHDDVWIPFIIILVAVAIFNAFIMKWANSKRPQRFNDKMDN
jgi:hypothetical protein